MVGNGDNQAGDGDNLLVLTVGRTANELAAEATSAGLPATSAGFGDRVEPAAVHGMKVLVLREDHGDTGYSRKAAQLCAEAGAAEIRELCVGWGWGEKEHPAEDADSLWGRATLAESSPRPAATASGNSGPDSDSDGLTLHFAPCGRNGTVTVTAKLAGDVLAVEKLDLGRSKQREAFAAAVCKDRPGIDPADIEALLLREAARLTETVGEAGPEAEPDPLAAMPEAVRAEAAALLESPHLLQTIVADIARLGVAGERELALTVYLVGTSRLLPGPLAAIIQGPSASGKSYVVERTARLFPPEAVIHATQMTPQALFHMEAGSLRNRFVVAGERSRLENDDRAEATRALREMLSGGRLSKLMPVKLGGEIVTQQIEQEGPIAYTETTTLTQIFDEDANRCILLNTDEQPEQTRRILTKLAANYSGAVPEGEAAAIIERHWAMQRMLKPTPVVVPYAERLAELLNDERVETRRAFPHLISTVRSLALLHQRQRQIDQDGRLLASPDDYQVARHLLAKPLGRLLGGRLSDPTQRFLERLRGWYDGEEFTAHAAALKERASRSSVKGWMRELNQAGFLTLIEAARGRTAAKWALAVDAPDETEAFLPTCETLFPDLACPHAHKQESHVA